MDDNEVNRRLIEKTLRRWRTKLTLVDSGQKALDALTAAEDRGEPFTLVLLDAHMPAMDGFEVARRMQTLTKSRSTLIMMLSSAGDAGDGARSRELGITMTLVKPIGPSDLLRAIGQLLTAAARCRLHPARRARRRPDPSQPRRILLAEDNPTNRILALRILEKRGHKVIVAENGKEAVDLLEQHEVDLVLMDVQMPVMGGFEATVAIRERERSTGRHMPIIAMTAHAMKGDRERCLDAGMDDYISKPVDSAKLLALVDRVGSAATASGAPSRTRSARRLPGMRPRCRLRMPATSTHSSSASAGTPTSRGSWRSCSFRMRSGWWVRFGMRSTPQSRSACVRKRTPSKARPEISGPRASLRPHSTSR